MVLVFLAGGGFVFASQEKCVFYADGLIECPVAVDYTRTIEQAIEAGGYNWSSEYINSKNFNKESNPESDPKKDVESTRQNSRVPTQIVLIQFNRHFYNAEDVKTALGELKSDHAPNGYRPAKPHELLALGFQYQDLQVKDWVGLGSSWVIPWGYRYVAYFDWYGYRRDFDLFRTAYVWDGAWRFAAVRK